MEGKNGNYWDSWLKFHNSLVDLEMQKPNIPSAKWDLLAMKKKWNQAFKTVQEGKRKFGGDSGPFESGISAARAAAFQNQEQGL